MHVRPTAGSGFLTAPFPIHFTFNFWIQRYVEKIFPNYVKESEHTFLVYVQTKTKVNSFLNREPTVLWPVIQFCKQKSFIINRYIQTLLLIDPVPTKCNRYLSAEFNGTWIKFLGIDAHLIRQHKKQSLVSRHSYQSN